MTGICRIDEGLNEIGANRVLALYGPGCTDRFLTTDYREVGLDVAAYEYLKQYGFRRVAFWSPSRQLYFLDPASRDSLLPDVRAQESSVARRLSPGPLGPPRARKPTETVVRPAKQGQARTLELIKWFMEQEEPRGALLMLQCEDFFRYCQDRSLVSGYFTWEGLPSSNRNICILTFAGASSREAIGIDIQEWKLPVLQRLLSVGDTFDTIRRLPAPDVIEIQRAVDYSRLRYRTQVDWMNRPRLERALEAEGLTLSSILTHLLNASELSQEAVSSWVQDLGDPTSAMDRLEGLIGLKEVKEALHARLAEEEERQHMRSTGKNVPDAPLHMVFSGNPGTGKTTVARLVAEILRDMGRLKRGHRHEVDATQLVSPFVSGTAECTRSAIDQAMDGVLFIDEAHQLLSASNNANHGPEVFKPLVAALENQYDRLVVILAGYEEGIRQVLASDEGLASRFPSRNWFHFPDFTASELREILFIELEKRHLRWTSEFEQASLRVCEAVEDAKSLESINGRGMRELANELFSNYSDRVHRTGVRDYLLEIQDFPTRWREFALPQADQVSAALSVAIANLESLIGLHGVKAELAEISAGVEQDILEGRTVQLSSLHMVFSGYPGTGKTSVAAHFGAILKALGLLRKGHVVRVSRENLIAGYVGQTAEKTAKAIQDAVEGILFIDEAYSLTPQQGTDFAREAIDTLTNRMEELRDRLVVIVAGYPDEMERFLEANPGLKSRFSIHIRFPNYSSNELVDILSVFANNDDYQLTAEVLAAAGMALKTQANADPRNFGNARAVRNLWDKMKRRRATRLRKASASDAERRIAAFLPSDVPS